MRVWATPFIHHGEAFTCFVAVNIADEKRWSYLEKIFLHDIMNTVAALRGFAELVTEAPVDTAERKELIERILLLSERVVDEINAHRVLVAAEHDELVVNVNEIYSLALITELYRTYNRSDMLHDRRIRLDDAAESIPFTSDKTLLSHVLGNMIKNAIEASSPGEMVTIGCIGKDDKIHFRVHNPTYMPESIGLQVSDRFFSTKGAGRGLGTFSMKYLTEKYLAGEISCTSSEKRGTTFTAVYPLSLE